MTRSSTTTQALLLGLASVNASIGLVGTMNWNQSYPDSKGIWLAKPIYMGNSAANNAGQNYNPLADATTIENGSCVSCIRNRNVWCARKQLWQRSGTNPFQQVMKSAGGIWTQAGGTDPVGTVDSAATNSATAEDVGQCCYNLFDVLDYARIGPIAILNTAAIKQTAQSWVMNKWNCAAKYTNDTGAGQCQGAATTVSAVTTAPILTTGWKYYCSDGDNNDANQNVNAKTVQGKRFDQLGSTKANAGADPRIELQLIVCRQMSTNCGGAAKIEDNTAIYDASVETDGTKKGKWWRTIVRTTMNKAEKCTFVHGTTKGAPTFKAIKEATQPNFVNGAAATAGSGWEFHYVEHSNNASFGAAPDEDGTTRHIKPWTANWNQLKARVYDKTMFNGYQENPNVWTAVDAAKMQVTTDVLFQAKRYFPVALAEKGLADYAARVTTFNGLKTAYDAAKTDYEKYLDKIAVPPDIWASLMGGATKIAVVVRPDLPKAPEAYTGYFARAYPLVSYDAIQVGVNAANKVAQNEFVVNGEQGGYASWTMGTLAPVIGGDMEHSFGVFGWAKTVGTYKASEQSFSRAWEDMCFPSAEATNGYCPVPTAGKLVENTKVNVLTVSLWAFDYAADKFDHATAAQKQSLTLQFSVSKWKQNYKAWQKPQTPTGPTAAKAPAGAKMLAASAAAAAAVAAALY